MTSSCFNSPNSVDISVHKKEQAEAVSEVVPKPKRPRTSYNLFFRDEQERLQGLILQGKCRIKRSNIANVISESWKNITPSVRLRYDQMAAEDKFRYMNERIEYKSYMERRRIQERRLQEATNGQRQRQTGVPKLTSRRKAAAATNTLPPSPAASTASSNGERVVVPSLPISFIPARTVGEMATAVAPSTMTPSTMMAPFPVEMWRGQAPTTYNTSMTVNTTMAPQHQKHYHHEPFSLVEQVSIATMARKLDADCIDFLIRALK